MNGDASVSCRNANLLDLQHLKDLQPENRGGAFSALTYGIIVERHCWHGLCQGVCFREAVFQFGVVQPGRKAPKGRLESANLHEVSPEKKAFSRTNAGW